MAARGGGESVRGLGGYLESQGTASSFTASRASRFSVRRLVQVNDYEAIQEAATAKKAARNLIRQIEESEERAEVVEVSAGGYASFACGWLV